MEKEEFSDLEKELLDAIKKTKVNPNDIPKIIKNLTQINPIKYRDKRIEFSDKKVKFLAFADAHMGHMNYRQDIMNKMTSDAKRQGCEFAINIGDTIEGMSNREGHIYELHHIGASAQFEFFKDEFAKFDKIPGFKVYSIEAQDSHGGWFRNKGNMGLNIGVELHEKNKHYEFIGYDEKDLVLDNGLKIRLRHPGGGTAYALSYKMQRYVESISGGQKPDMVFQGHFHKVGYNFYRNIHCYDAGCLQEQSPFMKKKGTPAHLGYWIVEVIANKRRKGVERVTNQFVPFFE